MVGKLDNMSLKGPLNLVIFTIVLESQLLSYDKNHAHRLAKKKRTFTPFLKQSIETGLTIEEVYAERNT